jgi:hypothetical protein
MLGSGCQVSGGYHPEPDTQHPKPRTWHLTPDTQPPAMLHIHNGDATADKAKQSSLPGKHFAWREALIEGPTPAGPDGSEWRSLRARHLSEAYGVDLQKCERDLLAQDKKLASFAEHEEVVLWFEHDLFCQVNLICLLNWFAHQHLGKTRLSLVSIDSFPGKENFRGLGELKAEELASLFPARQQVATEQLDLAGRAWQAYCSRDPSDIQTLINTDVSALPFLSQALTAHLKRFPSTTNGLGNIENRGLQLVGTGLKNFGDLFTRFGEAEPVYGLGDSQFWLALCRMSEAGQPLLAMENGLGNGANGQELTPAVAQRARFKITDLGEAVLKGDADFVLLNGIDQWLGGVYLSGERNLWRWDEASETIVLT